MDLASPENPTPTRSRWQFSLRQMFAATTGVAIVFALAAWGGWVKSDAVVYLSLAVLVGEFVRATRWALMGAGTIIGAFWLAVLLGHIIFGPGVGPHHMTPEAVWIFFVLILASSGLLRMYTNASTWSLLVSLVLIEIFIGAVVVYSYGCPTLFQAFASDNRGSVLWHFRETFPPADIHLLVAAPWLAGIIFGKIVARNRNASGADQKRL